MTELIDWLKSEEKSFVDARVAIKDAKFGKGLFAEEGKFQKLSNSFLIHFL